MLRYQGIPINPSLSAEGFKRQPNADSAVRRSCGVLTLCRISYLSLHPFSGLKQLEQGISGIATCFIGCYAVRRRSLRSSEQVSGASYPRWTSVQHMGIDHGGFHIAVAEQFLNRADVGALFQ